jgi:small subunit ribosomal protein S17
MAKNENKTKKEEKLVETIVKPIVGTRGRIFEGVVRKRFPKRVVIEFERTKYDKKYERYSKAKTKLHARLPDDLEINVGDYVRIRECRPLSKLIHFIVIKKIRSIK